MAIDDFQAILGQMLGPRTAGSALPIFDPERWLPSEDESLRVTESGAPVRSVRAVEGPSITEGASPAEGTTTTEASTASLTAAFLVALCGRVHPAFGRAIALLVASPADSPAGLADLYRRAVILVPEEIERACADDPDVADRLARAAERLGSPDAGDPAEILWSVFFPEGVGIRGHEAEREANLRAARTVTVVAANPEPILDPGRQLLFTSNVLLTIPSATRPVEALPYPAELRRDLVTAADEPQAHWYDHPIQIGVEQAGNELLYGLRGLDEAVEFERQRTPGTGRVTCLLSVSVTHPGLHAIARPYVEAELAAAVPLRHLDVCVFTEDDTERLVDGVLGPAADRYLPTDPAAAPEARRARLREVFGVDGAYGRHYTFLKAVTALWQVLIAPDVRGTFKIDLDQVFPQAELVAETGASAFEHLETPLWGAIGVDLHGRELELGMIAGALVNERDIGRGLFTPDVAYPSGPLAPDRSVFFSAVPQALSTRAEMMERYDTADRDGRTRCIQRVHVTGGTNGILVDALRRHRPFTPSFVGRAEDQAYLLSVLGRSDADGADGSRPRLAYAHAAGLIMRHDKDAFAGEAMAAAEAGKVIGDDVRILQFSAYASAIAEPGDDPAPDAGWQAGRAVKEVLDPFTGCFVSRLPVTVVMLRFALRLVQAFDDGHGTLGLEMAEIGARRLNEALDFTSGDALRSVVERERAAWNDYYDVLDALERAIAAGDPFALDIREHAREIVAGARVSVA